MYLIDTCILIDYQNLKKEAINFLDNFELPCVKIPVIAKMEFIKGARDKTELNLLNNLLSKFQIIDLDNDISKLATSLLEIHHLKNNLSIPDSLIGATAIIKNKTLITKNIRDFEIMNGIKLMKPY